MTVQRIKEDITPSAWEEKRGNVEYKWVFVSEANGLDPIYMINDIDGNIIRTGNWNLKIDEYENLIMNIGDFEYPLKYEGDEMIFNPETEGEKKLIRVK